MTVDIGGTILFRHSSKILGIKRQTDYQIKHHFHYYRPYYDDFLQSLIEHPRVKFGFYTSIMRKNVMPLMFKIFENPKIKELKNNLFDVYDQTYNVPDI